MTSAPINAIFVGKARARWEGAEPSAIWKAAVEGTVQVTKTGLVGDEQADLSVHGGPDKALHLYPADHYPHWQEQLGENVRFQPGGFGENISPEGFVEDQVCIGDTFQLGSAKVQISQGRQPCWKLVAHTDQKRMATLVTKTLRTGWYFRVLEEGVLAAGDALTLLDRPQPNWSVKRVTGAVMGYRTPAEDYAAMAELPELFDGWREWFRQVAG